MYKSITNIGWIIQEFSISGEGDIITQKNKEDYCHNMKESGEEIQTLLYETGNSAKRLKILWFNVLRINLRRNICPWKADI